MTNSTLRTKLVMIFYLLTYCTLISCTDEHNDHKVFTRIYQLLEQDNFFKAEEYFRESKEMLSKPYRVYVESILDNAFNRLESSEVHLNEFFTEETELPDSLHLNLYLTTYDNALKSYQYKRAKYLNEYILKRFDNSLDSSQVTEFNNSLKIWSAIENVPPQQLLKKGDTKMSMVKDRAGLNTLEVKVEDTKLPFVFDTGANLSTTTLSIANKLKMNILPEIIQVGTITGNKVSANIAVCDFISIGNLEFCNVVFLVLPDEALSFPEINYKIFGILGYPIIEALGEISITANGYFMVSKDSNRTINQSNLAMKGLTPLIYLDQKHFTFDTGADHTMLYQAFYKENKAVIDEQYKPELISFGGAGGIVELMGFTGDYTFNLNNSNVTLKDVSILKDKISPSETVYGNIGQDLIRQFDTLTFNFQEMFIRLH